MPADTRLNGDADILKMRDIAAHRAHIHLQASSQPRPTNKGLGLQQFEHRENATGWMVHFGATL